MDIAQETKSISEANIYGSFFLGGIEYALAVSSLEEVVNIPDEIFQIPLAPDFILGAFRLRQLVIPIIDFGAIVAAAHSDKKDKKIAIINVNGARLGLCFDRIGEILRPKEKEVSNTEYGTSSESQIFRGVIKLDEGKRVLQVVNYQSLVSVYNASNFSADTSSSIQSAKQVKTSEQVLLFSIDQDYFAFDMKYVTEIVNMQQINTALKKSDLSLGTINMRGSIIPVLDSKAIFSGKASSDDYQNHDAKIIILKLGTDLLGFLVDSVEDICSYDKATVTPVPLLSPDRIEMFKGYLSYEKFHNVLMVGVENMFSDTEMASITLGINNEEGDSKNKESLHTHNNESVESTYILFKLDNYFCFPISEVSEIINYDSTDLLDTLNDSPYIKGMVNLRGTLVNIVDLRKFYEMKEVENIDMFKILVFKKQDKVFGLIVDQVESILKVRKQQHLDFSLGKNIAKDTSQANDISDVVQVEQEEKPLSVPVLNIDSIYQRLFS